MRRLPALAAFFLFPSAAFAHTGLGATHGFLHGFMHPVSGADHVLAMVAVGLFAVTLGGRALVAVPAAFVAMMAAGGALGIAGVAVPFVEAGIGLSIVAIGAAAAFGQKLPVAAAMALVGVFAIFHGHAHGAEMPANAGGLAYALGFMVATAALHGLGIAFGLAASRLGGSRGAGISRLGGGAMALAGVAVLGGLI